MLDLVMENILGEAKGTPLEEAAEANFRGETAEVGLYLAMAHQAQREGYPEVAETLKTIATEEAQHATRYALLNGKISSSTKENLEKMLAGEHIYAETSQMDGVDSLALMVDAGLSSRLLFATHAPLFMPLAGIARILLDLNEADATALLGGNARRLLARRLPRSHPGAAHSHPGCH